jgi:hypothetical protein
MFSTTPLFFYLVHDRSPNAELLSVANIPAPGNSTMVTIGKKDLASTTTSAGRPLLRIFIDTLCGCSIDSTEYLEPTSYSRLSAPGEYYIDTHNDISLHAWTFSFGTGEDNGIWMNSGDQAGSIMATLVWLLMTYSAVTVTLLTVTKGLHIPVFYGLGMSRKDVFD